MLVELAIWLLIVLSVTVPLLVYLLPRLATEASPRLVSASGSRLDTHPRLALHRLARYAPVRVWQPRTGRSGLHVQVGNAVDAGSGVTLPFDGQESLCRNITTLLECLMPATRAQGIPLHELFSPAFVAAHSHFSAIHDMFEAIGCNMTLQEDCDKLSGAAWDVFVRSNTRFDGWDDMLQSACCHWMAHEILTRHVAATRPRKSPTVARTTITDPHAVHRRHASSTATPFALLGMASRPAVVARTFGVGHE